MTVTCHAFREAQTGFLQAVADDSMCEYAAPGIKTRIVVAHAPFSQRQPAPFDIEEETYREWCRILRKNIKPDLMLFAHTHEYGIHPVGSEWDHLGQPCPAVIGAEPRKDRFIGCGLIIRDDKISVVFTDSNGQTFGHSSIYR